MKLENGKITGTQMMLAVACFTQASSLLTSFITGITKQDSWVAIILGTLICIPLIFVYVSLINTFPSKNLVEMNELVLGKAVGTILTILYLFFFLTLATLNLRDIGIFVKQTIMVETPDVVLMGACMLVSAWAIRYGLEVVIRYSFLFLLIALTVLALSLIFVTNLMDINNFLPAFDLPFIKYVQGTHVITAIPFGEIVVFLMIAPHVLRKNKSVGRYIFGGFLIGGFTILLVVLRDTAVLGNTLNIFALPSFETLRMATLSESISRMEVLFAIVLIVLLFYKITILYYVTVVMTAQLFKMETYRPIVLVIGVLMISYGFLMYPSSIQHAATGQESLPFIWTTLEFIFPLLTLVIAKMRKLGTMEEKA